MPGVCGLCKHAYSRGVVLELPLWYEVVKASYRDFFYLIKIVFQFQFKNPYSNGVR